VVEDRGDDRVLFREIKPAPIRAQALTVADIPVEDGRGRDTGEFLAGGRDAGIDGFTCGEPFVAADVTVPEHPSKIIEERLVVGEGGAELVGGRNRYLLRR